MNDQLKMRDRGRVSVRRGRRNRDLLHVHGTYEAVCYGADGVEKWRRRVTNLVTTVGLNLLLDAALGNASVGPVVMGLKGAGAPIAEDTQASHAGWNEIGGVNAPAYSGGRSTPEFGAAANGYKSTSSDVVFNFTSGGSCDGFFINVGGSSEVDDTTGVLLSAGDFDNGPAVVTGGDMVAVTYTIQVSP